MAEGFDDKNCPGHSPAIFQNDNGNPRRFYILPSQLKAKLRTLIEAGGGSLSSKYIPGAIKLVEPGTCNAGKAYEDYISTDFIFKCVEERQFLKLKNFRIEKDKVGNHQTGENAPPSKVQSSTVTTSNYIQMSGRQPYSPEEDLAIVDFVKQNRKGKITTGGNVLWKQAEERRVTLHSWQSMRDRFLKHLQPRKKSINCKQVIVSKYFGRKGFENKVAFPENQRKSIAYGALNVAAKTRQSGRGRTTDEAVSAVRDSEGKPPAKQKELLARLRSIKNPTEERICTEAEEQDQDVEEMPGANTVHRDVVSNGDLSDCESESADSRVFDKELIAAAQHHMKTQGSPQEIGEHSSRDEIKDFSASSQDNSEPVGSSSQDKQTEDIVEGAGRSEKTNSQFGVADFVGTVSERVTRKHIKDTRLDAKGTVCAPEVVGKPSGTSTPKAGGKDSRAVVFSTDEDCFFPYKTRLRKRKSSPRESKNESKRQVLESSCSESESESESQSVLPSFDESRDRKYYLLRSQSPRLISTRANTSDRHLQVKGIVKGSDKSDENNTKQSPRKKAATAIRKDNESEGNAEVVHEDVGLKMAQSFKELLSINDASLAEITHILFMSTGSIEATRKYLQTGNIPADLWTWEEDQMLDTKEIHKVIRKRGLKSVNERIEFLSGN